MEPHGVSGLRFRPDGTPFSVLYDDIYHSAAGALEQARHVFLRGNDLPERWRRKERFTILETGFGLGLNFLVTWRQWRNDPNASRELHFISLEKHPLAAGELTRAHRAWVDLRYEATLLHAHWPPQTCGEHRIELEEGRLILRLVFGDAVCTLPELEAAVDAFYLDGFSPAKNPELWSPELCRLLARRASPGATLATWSVAGAVRRALSSAGFAVEKRPGFAGKREMLTGRLMP